MDWMNGKNLGEPCKPIGTRGLEPPKMVRTKKLVPIVSCFSWESPWKSSYGNLTRNNQQSPWYIMVPWSAKRGGSTSICQLRWCWCVQEQGQKNQVMGEIAWGKTPIRKWHGTQNLPRWNPRPNPSAGTTLRPDGLTFTDFVMDLDA